MVTPDWHVLLKFMSRSVEIEIFTVVGSLVGNSKHKVILKCRQQLLHDDLSSFKSLYSLQPSCCIISRQLLSNV